MSDRATFLKQLHIKLEMNIMLFYQIGNSSEFHVITLSEAAKTPAPVEMGPFGWFKLRFIPCVSAFAVLIMFLMRKLKEIDCGLVRRTLIEYKTPCQQFVVLFTLKILKIHK